MLLSVGMGVVFIICLHFIVQLETAASCHLTVGSLNCIKLTSSSFFPETPPKKISRTKVIHTFCRKSMPNCNIYEITAMQYNHYLFLIQWVSLLNAMVIYGPQTQ